MILGLFFVSVFVLLKVSVFILVKFDKNELFLNKMFCFVKLEIFDKVVGMVFAVNV